MLSLIVCCRNESISKELFANVKDSCECDLEWIIIDNSRNDYTIFSAYNEGVNRSHGDILCFMHDDVLFRSKGWGKIVQTLFCENPQLGLLGVIGSCFLPSYPAQWGLYNTGIGHVIQGNVVNNHYETFIDGRMIAEKWHEAVSVDGLCFFIKKSMFEDNCFLHFDEQLYRGFHCYDLDICMQVLASGFKVGVVGGVDIEHKSIGNANSEYWRNLGIFVNKWKNMLPIERGMDKDDLLKSLNEAIISSEKNKSFSRRIKESVPYRLYKMMRRK